MSLTDAGVPRPCAPGLTPITAHHRDGQMRTVWLRDQAYVLARFDGKRWVDPRGACIGFEPTHVGDL